MGGIGGRGGIKMASASTPSAKVAILLLCFNLVNWFHVQLVSVAFHLLVHGGLVSAYYDFFSDCKKYGI